MLGGEQTNSHKIEFFEIIKLYKNYYLVPYSSIG